MMMSESRDPPFATATVAQIYMRQGRLAEAEALFEKLLRQSPGNPRLLQGVEEVRRRRETERAAAATDFVRLELEGEKARCQWSVSERGMRRARLVLGQEGRLALRLVTFPEGEGGPLQDLALEQGQGCITLDLEPRGAVPLVMAAVGLVASGGQFVSIAHSGPVRT